MSNDTDIAILQQQMQALVSTVTNLTNTHKEILDQLNTFNTAIKTGKWIFVSFLLTMGALGHKGYDWAAKFLTGQ